MRSKIHRSQFVNVRWWESDWAFLCACGHTCIQLLDRASGLAVAQVGQMLSRSPITRRSRRRRTNISILTQHHDVDRLITRRTRRHCRLTTSKRRRKLRRRLTRPLWRQGQAPTVNRYPRRLTHSAQVWSQ